MAPTRQSRRALTSIGIGLVAALPALLVQRRRLRRAAEEREAERIRLSAQIITAEQDERRRLSVTLHDGPLQSLAGIVLMHDAALAAIHEGKTEEAAGLLETALPKERATIQVLRDLSFAMEPIVLRDQGFEAATRALADLLTRGGTIAVDLDVATADLLGEKAQAALYQTLREALTQAEHRRPARISVAVVESEAGGFEARIADDGRKERRRAGIDAIEERARMLGGTVTVETGEAGTLVRIAIPSYVAAAS